MTDVTSGSSPPQTTAEPSLHRVLGPWLLLLFIVGEHEHFRTPTFPPIVGAVSCAFFAGPWTGRDPIQYTIAGVLIGIGIVLWFVTVAVNRAAGVRPSEPEMEDIGGPGPRN